MSDANDNWTIVGPDNENDATSMSTGVLVDTLEDDIISLWSDFDINTDNSSQIDTSHIPQTTLRRVGTITTSTTDDTSCIDSSNNTLIEHLDEEYNARSAADSKRSMKHSLIKRHPAWAASMDFSRQTDEYIDVVRDPSHKGKESHTLSKTAVDDLLPELLAGGRPSATLGRDKRWKRVLELLDSLEKEGNAVRCPALPEPSRLYAYVYKPRHYPFEGPPHEIIRYSVKPNGTYRSKSARDHVMDHYSVHTHRGHDQAVHHRRNGRWKVWYELSLESPADVLQQGATPLRGSLDTPTGKRSLQGSARHAFSPGVATICGVGSSQSHVPPAQQAVVANEVQLNFGRKVAVSHASIAGKIHDTELESLRRTKEDDYGPRRNEPHTVVPGTSRRMKRHCHVALEGTDAYCDRVEISARQSHHSTFTVLGTFDACRDGHTEKSISLATCDVASRIGAVHCVALRFRAISWHNKPLLRVGAYGHEIDDDSNNAAVKQEKKNKPVRIGHDSAAFEDGVEYILHRSKRYEDGNDALRRRYAFKGSSTERNWKGWNYHDSRAARRRNFRSDVREALS